MCSREPLWHSRSPTFVVPRIPLPFAAYKNMSAEAGSYFLFSVALVALFIANLITDWRVVASGRLVSGFAQGQTPRGHEA